LHVLLSVTAAYHGNKHLAHHFSEIVVGRFGIPVQLQELKQLRKMGSEIEEKLAKMNQSFLKEITASRDTASPLHPRSPPALLMLAPASQLREA
jgi:hypothetical protein